MDHLKNVLGDTLRDTMMPMLPVLTDIANFMADKLPAGVAAAGKGFSAIGRVVGPVIDNVKGLFGTFKSGAGGKDSTLGQVQTTFTTLFESVKTIVKSAVTIITILWDAFGDHILTVLRRSFSAILLVLRGAFNIIAGLFQVVASLMKGDWAGVWEGIKKILRGAWQVILGVVRLAWAELRFIFTNAGTILKGIFGRLWDGLKRLVVLAWKEMPGLVLKGEIALLNVVKALPGKIVSVSVGLMRSAGGKLIDAFIDGLKVGGGVAASFASAIWTAVKGAINSGIDALNGLLDFSVKVGPKTFHVSAPNIGHLYRGTDSWRGGPTWVGERGPELVNLARGASVAPADRSRRAAAGVGGSSGGTVVGALTITNWEEGTGYFRTIAADEVDDSADFGRTLERMGR